MKDKKKYKHTLFTLEQRREIERFYKSCISIPKLAQHFNCSYMTMVTEIHLVTPYTAEGAHAEKARRLQIRRQGIHNLLLGRKGSSKKDLSQGQIFGSLTVLEILPKESPQSNSTCRLRCTCGNEFVCRTTYLWNGKKTECKQCTMKKRRIVSKLPDKRSACHSGKKYGHWTGIKFSRRITRNETYWFFQGECGHVQEIVTHRLLSGYSYINCEKCGHTQKKKFYKKRTELSEVQTELKLFSFLDIVPEEPKKTRKTKILENLGYADITRE